MRIKIQLHPYHLVELSPWPLLLSFSLLNLAISGVGYFHCIYFSLISVLLSFITLIYCIILWFNDVTIEGTYLGLHTEIVQSGLNLGFYLFVISEVIFFFSLFWAYLHSSLTPNIELGSIWPPIGIKSIDPIIIPLFNTILLLSSGFAITYSHHALLNGNRYNTLIGFLFTLILAFLFLIGQILEYSLADFSLADSVYGSTFYLATGFHFLHVFIGTLFLFISFKRFLNYQLTITHHIGTNIAILYWHFVDVVWLILFAIIYIWASI